MPNDANWAWKPAKSEKKLKRKLKRDRRKLKPQFGANFYNSEEWLRLRYRVLKQYKASCMCCGKRGSRDHPIHVDHIKPRSRYPLLALSFDNLQVLCSDCNLGKGAWDETDWRPFELLPTGAAEHMQSL